MSQVVPACGIRNERRIFPQHCCSWQNSSNRSMRSALIADPGFGDQADRHEQAKQQTRVDAHCSREQQTPRFRTSSNHSGNPCRRTSATICSRRRTALGYRAIKFVEPSVRPDGMTRRLNTSVFLHGSAALFNSCNNAAAHKTSCC